jgi:hypothetical protein
MVLGAINTVKFMILSRYRYRPSTVMLPFSSHRDSS